jgi:hypothetical protein
MRSSASSSAAPNAIGGGCEGTQSNASASD